MTTLQIETEVVVPVSAAAVYRVLADYAGARRRLQSRRSVSDLRVKAGGIGGGTRFAVVLHGPHGELPLDVVVTEPEAGTVLIEADAAAGVRRTFVLEPCSRGQNTRVQAVLEIDGRHIDGPLEHALRALHAMELRRLPRAAADRALQDSLWPHPLDAERSAAFVPQPACG